MFRNHDVRYILLLLGLSLLTWIPRFRGPIDLRYDAGVSYILGTSLAEGKGYRLLNEPGKAHGHPVSATAPRVRSVWPCSGSTLQPNGFNRTSLSSCPTALGESNTRRKRQSL